MVVFGIEAEDNGIVKSFMQEIEERLNNKSKTPFFIGRVINFENKYIIYIRILFPPYFLFGFVFWIMGFIYTGRFLWAWFIPGLIVIFPLIFWNWFTYYLLFRIGLRKKGYKDKVKLL